LHILLANDDGYFSAGLAALRTQLEELGKVTVVAPNRNRSGASNSLTLDRPLRIEEIEPNTWSVDGTPTDCVHVAITGLLDEVPDMVVSGINHGANLGDDVLYSGTVAAAMEGRTLGLPAVALSLVTDGGGHFDAAAQLARRLIEPLLGARPLPGKTILNINIPDLPLEQVGGMQSTRLGFRHKAEPAIRALDDESRPVFWVGPAGAGQDAGPGTDFYAVTNGFVSVTPIHVDLTEHLALAQVAQWLEQL
jgi:5'-nucleotidase